MRLALRRPPSAVSATAVLAAAVGIGRAAPGGGRHGRRGCFVARGGGGGVVLFRRCGVYPAALPPRRFLGVGGVEHLRLPVVDVVVLLLLPLLRGGARLAVDCSRCCSSRDGLGGRLGLVGGAADVRVPQRLGPDGLVACQAQQLAGVRVCGVGVVDAAGRTLLTEEGADVGHGGRGCGR